MGIGRDREGDPRWRCHGPCAHGGIGHRHAIHGREEVCGRNGRACAKAREGPTESSHRNSAPAPTHWTLNGMYP